MHEKNRTDIQPGLRVHSTQKHDQRTGRLPSGFVQDMLITGCVAPTAVSPRTESAGSRERMGQEGMSGVHQRLPL